MACMYLHVPRDPRRFRFAFLAAAAALVLAMLLLAHHTPRRFVELELVVPIVLLLYAGQQVASAERDVAGAGRLAPVIAVVGTDGSGKSSLSVDLEQLLGRDRSVVRCYLGLGSGELGNRIRRWPLIGSVLERKLAGKAAQTRDKSKAIPGLATALVVFGFSLLRLRRFRKVLALRRQGVTVVTDRYPQTEVLGFYDGPGLSAARAGNSLVAWLARRERRMYDWMASFQPDIVLRLNVDAPTALARKPDHKAELIEAKIAATSSLRFGGAHMVDIDARQDYERVRSQALAWIAPALQASGVTRRRRTERP